MADPVKAIAHAAKGLQSELFRYSAATGHKWSRKRGGCLARTRNYENPHAGLAPEGLPSHRASQPSGTQVHNTKQAAIDDSLKEVLASWRAIPPTVREAIVAIIRCTIAKGGHEIEEH